MEPDRYSGAESGLYYLKGGYYVSSEPLKPNILYQLQLDKATSLGLCPCTMQFGVSKPCSSYCELIKDMSLYQWKFCNKEGGVVGLMIDSSNKLHFYFDGKDIDTVTEKVSGPRYAIFKFNHRWKMTPLPLKMMERQVQGSNKESLLNEDTVPPLAKVKVVQVQEYYKEISNGTSNKKQSSCTVS